MRRLRNQLPLLASVLLVSIAAGAQVNFQADDALLKKVDDHYNHLRSFRARYTQRYAGLGMERSESGTLLLKKPGKMRWDYDTPKGKLFVLDGKYGWTYAPGDAQAQRIPAKQIDDLRSPLRFLLGHTQMKKELDGLTVAQVGKDFAISGVPKGMAERVKLLTLTTDAAGQIESIRLEETDGALTEFRFSEVQENLPIKDAEFVFTPPAGVTVVDGLPPI